MITVTTNINQVVGGLITKIESVASPQGLDKLLRSITVTMAGEVAHRVHTEGQKADGSQIGTYSPSYMKVRTGKYSTNKKISKGKNKGETKTEGVFTRGKKKGQSRPNYNRTDDTKKVYSLTRQMENDFGLVDNKEPMKTATGYGLGFKNPDNAQKAAWQKEYAEVYKLSEGEKQKAIAIGEDFISNAFQTR